ncbi:uncharacterized protein VTP21DRAFT_3315 [Calcarisporiella thermophila]|uniref:uncharacterized protein n=1 Tax=Calcarisporiella thermophila TaxID=911321 RepID=UPI0037439053
MISAGPTGFYNASVTKGILLGVGGCSLLASILNLKPMFHLQLIPHLTRDHQFWRLVTSHVAFTNSGELFFGMLIIYHLRVIERQFGSVKYAAFVFVSVAMATILEVGALMIWGSLNGKYIPAGPYGFIYAALYQYYKLIPETYRFRLFGVPLTDKIYLYVLASQLLISHFPNSVVAGVCGLVAGMLYRADVANVKRWRFPGVLVRFAKRWLEPLLASRPTIRSNATTQEQRARMLRDDIRSRQQTAEAMREYLGSLARAEPGGINPPSDEEVSMLVAMFPNIPRETVVQALTSSNNDVSRAVEYLLSTTEQRE